MSGSRLITGEAENGGIKNPGITMLSQAGQNGDGTYCISVQFRQANPAPTASVSASCPLILIYNKTTSSASSPGHDEAWGTEDGAKSMAVRWIDHLKSIVGQALPLAAQWVMRSSRKRSGLRSCSCSVLVLVLVLDPDSHLSSCLPHRSSGEGGSEVEGSLNYLPPVLFLFVFVFLIH